MHELICRRHRNPANCCIPQDCHVATWLVNRRCYPETEKQPHATRKVGHCEAARPKQSSQIYIIPKIS